MFKVSSADSPVVAVFLLVVLVIALLWFVAVVVVVVLLFWGCVVLAGLSWHVFILLSSGGSYKSCFAG